MKVVIQVTTSDDAKAWALLVRHSPGVALANHTYVVTQEAALALQKAGIRFTELAVDAEAQAAQGMLTGERI